MSTPFPSRKSVRSALVLVGILDLYLLAAAVEKVATVGIKGLFAWIRHMHYVPLPSANGEPSYQLQSDYGFTLLIVGIVLGAFAATFFLLRSHSNMARHQD
jgi:hypothetical protein